MFRLNPAVRRWLNEPDLDPGADDDVEGDWDSWARRHMALRGTFALDAVEVDELVLSQRFACVSERCAPGRERGRYECCCADAEAGLTRSERSRLLKVEPALTPYLLRREPRLREVEGEAAARRGGLFIDAAGAHLARPGERCACSAIDRQGRIRCRLWPFAADQGIPRSAVQPYTCRIFPLTLVGLSDGRTLLSVLNRRNHVHMGANPPRRYPCLDDKALPHIFASLAGDLDWLFGTGFAQALTERARDPG